MTTGVTVIFLDIDGVLLPFGETKDTPPEESASNLFPDRTLAALNSIVQHVPNAGIVLSSTWRVRPDYCQQILQAFEDYNQAFQGVLPNEFHDLTNIETHSERQWEIHDWLVAHHLVEQQQQTSIIQAWVALDDEELLEEEKNQKHRPEFEGHVVKTTSSIGLTKMDAETALRLLKLQQKKRKR